MKKILYVFLFTLWSILGRAGEVPKEVAEKAAKNYLFEQTAKSQNTFDFYYELIRNQQNMPVIHVFNQQNNEGFVLVSASNNTVPILAYAEKGNFDAQNLPPGVKQWIENYRHQIAQAEAKSEKGPGAEFWDKYATEPGKFQKNKPKGEAVEPLTDHIIWDQGAGWNAYAPAHAGGPGGRAYAGCVATATAIIMKYHAHPTQGTGSHSYNHSTNYGHDEDFGVLTADFNTTYNWTAMPNNTYSDESAKLLYHLGVAVEMNFSKDGSGSQSSDAIKALKHFFGYDQQIMYKGRYKYSDQQWIEMVREELKQQRPILYSGYGNDGGHAFVCDGINAADYFHFNWGWSGAYNGYFYVTDLAPGGADFSQNQEAAFGIKPDDNLNEYLVQEQVIGHNATSRGIANISVVNNQTVWTIAFDGSDYDNTIMEMAITLDGGTNWTSKPINLKTPDLRISMIQALNKDTAWVAAFDETASGNGGIFYTYNRGNTWTKIPNLYANEASFPNVVYFFNENEGFAQGDPIGNDLECYYTTDGGKNWTTVPDADMPNAQDQEYGTVDRYAATTNFLYFSTNKGRIFKSANKGKTWTAFQTPLASVDLVRFSSDNYGIVGQYDQNTSSYEYYYTNDGAQNWEKLETKGPVMMADLVSVPGSENMFFSVGLNSETGRGASFSTDYGVNWALIPETEFEYFMTAGFSDITNGWFGEYSTSPTKGGIIKYNGNSILAAFSTNTQTACENKDVVFQNQSFAQNTLASYQWKFGTDATPATANTAGPHQVVYSANGLKTITLTVTDNQGKKSVREEKLFVEKTPVADFSFEVQGARVVFTNQSTDALSYAWNFGDGTTNQTESPMHDYTENNTYNVALTAINNVCEDVLEKQVNVTNVSIDKMNQLGLKIYPNPATDRINIEGLKTNGASVIILDLNGKKIKQTNANAQNKLSLDISNLPVGIYFLEVESDGAKSVFKIMKR